MIMRGRWWALCGGEGGRWGRWKTMLRRKTDSKIGKYTLSELAKTTSTWIIKKNILCGNLSVKISRIPQGILFPYWHLGFLHLYIRSLTHPHSRTYSFTHLYSLIYTYSHSLIQISCLLYVVGVGQCALLRGWSYSLASLGFRPFFDIPYITKGSPEDWLVAFCDRRENRGLGAEPRFRARNLAVPLHTGWSREAVVRVM